MEGYVMVTVGFKKQIDFSQYIVKNLSLFSFTFQCKTPINNKYRNHEYKGYKL